MNSRKKRMLVALAFWGFAFLPLSSQATEIFIYRPARDGASLSRDLKLTVHGEIFGHLLAPSTFPSYNDGSGPTDRWNFGFQNRISLTPTTVLFGQLVTHDSGGRRTKFDWHFNLRQTLFKGCVLIIGHDSDHDSEHESYVRGKPYYLNRNTVGLGLPFEGEGCYIEPFTRFFHHSNQLAYLDFSGEKIKQEYGIRAAAWTAEGLSVHGQAVFQTEALFGAGQVFSGEVFVRFALAPWLEISIGASLCHDMSLSPLGLRQSFHKILWGLALPF